MMNRLLCAAILVFWLGGCWTAKAEVELRQVLAIHNASAFGYDADAVATRRLAEFPLSYIGLDVIQYDWAARGAPDEALSQSVRGAVIWFDGDTLDDPDAFLDWASTFMADGHYIVLMGPLTFLLDEGRQPATAEKVETFFERLGVEFENRSLDDFHALEVTVHDPDFAPFERGFSAMPPSAPVLQVSGTVGRPIVTLTDETGAASDVVAIVSGGGLAFGPYGHVSFPSARMEYWMVDPIRFFSAALRMQDVPAPDTTTLFGNRVYFSHVDGDGWTARSSVPNHEGVLSISAEVMRRELIAPFPDLPLSVAPISAELDLTLVGSEESRAAARAIFELSNVEAATHTHTHPVDWDFYRSGQYDEEVEAKLFGRPSQTRSPFQTWLSYVSIRATSSASAAVDDYKNPNFESPRTYYDGPFEIKQEIEASRALIEELLPVGKSVKLVQWPGDARPDANFLRVAREAGLETINGGDARFDAAFPSLSFIPPTTRKVGGEVQVLAVQASDLFYSQVWPDRYMGFRDVIETIARTGAPRRLRPVNIHYHVQSAGQQGPLADIKRVLEYVRTLDIMPVSTSRYTAMAKNAGAVELFRIQNGWRVKSRGAIGTLRFNEASFDAIDFAASTGVIGASHEQGQVYVTLDPAVEDAVLIFSDEANATGASPYLETSRWPISNVKLEKDRASFHFDRGFGGGRMTWVLPDGCEATISTSAGDNNFITEQTGGLLHIIANAAPAAGSQMDLVCQQ